jgi:hypothetical protein
MDATEAVPADVEPFLGGKCFPARQITKNMGGGKMRKLLTICAIGSLIVGGAAQMASAAATTTIYINPTQVPADGEEQPRVNLNDAPAGFGIDSWQGPATGKSNWHARYLADGDYLSALFPADAAGMTVADLASISYYTKRPNGTPASRDWWVQIYTRPTGSGDKSTWYHDRYINNYGSHTSTDVWTQYSTDTGMTFQSNGWGGPVQTLAEMITAHGSELIEMISIQTDSGWNGFDGYVDGLEITLTNGDVGRVNLVPEPASLAMIGLGGLMLLRRRH